MPLQQALIVAFGIAGLGWYYVCLVSVGYWPLPLGHEPDAFRQFMSLSVTTIGVSLATFVGMLLGIQGVGKTAQAAAIGGGAWTTRLQWLAAGLYVLSLLIAIALWRLGGDTTDPAVSNLAKSLLGLIGGALSILLNLPK